MFCENCGKEVGKDAKFCKNCGASLNQESKSIVSKKAEIKNDTNLYNDTKKDIKLYEDKEKKIQSKRNAGLAGIVLLSVLIIVLLITSLVGGPTNSECIKVIKVDGVNVTYRYDYMPIDGETIVQKRYEGTDSAGNEVKVYVTVWFEGEFEGKIDEYYTPTESDKMYEGAYYKQVKITGTINGHKVNDEDEKLLIDNEIYEKYTDMIDEVEACDLYVKFIDGTHTYTKVVKSRVRLLIALAVCDVIGIAAYVFQTIKDKKILNGSWDEDKISKLHKVGIGVLIVAILTLITSIIMFISGVRWIDFLAVIVTSYILSMFSCKLFKDGKLKRIVKITSTMLIVLLTPIILLLLFLGITFG